MKKIALLGLQLVTLVPLMVLSYIAIRLLTPNDLSDVGGVTSVLLPPILVMAASMYAIRRTFNVAEFGAVKKAAFYSLSLAASLLLTAVGVFIAFGVIVQLFGE